MQGQVGIIAIKNMGIYFIPSNNFEEFWLYYPPPSPSPHKFQPQIPLKINKLTNFANVRERKTAPC